MIGKRQKKTKNNKLRFRRKRGDIISNKEAVAANPKLLLWGSPGEHYVSKGVLNTPDVGRPIETLERFMNRVRTKLALRKGN